MENPCKTMFVLFESGTGFLGKPQPEERWKGQRLPVQNGVESFPA